MNIQKVIIYTLLFMTSFNFGAILLFVISTFYLEAMR